MLVQRVRGHRAPYVLLFLALVFSLVASGGNIALTYYLNLPVSTPAKS